MFSIHNPSLVTYSDRVSTRYSASANRTNGDLQCDLIAFLSIAQECSVQHLPNMWQLSLSSLGMGVSGAISQSTFTTDMPLAFKRFCEDGEMDFLL
jgi:hypothetical protein